MNAVFADRLRESFVRHSNLPAIDARSGQYTFDELDRASARLARRLSAAGASAGDIIPLFLPRSPALVIAQVALVRIGAAYAPFDLSGSPTVRRTMLDQIKPRIVITQAGAPPIPYPGASLLEMELSGDEPGDEAPGVWAERSASDLACIMFTSGTTGGPKAVMVPAAGIARLVCDADYASFKAASRWSFLSSPAFDASALEIWAPLLNGGCCVIQEEGLLPSLDDIASFLRDESITDAWLTSALFNALVDDRIDAFADLHQLLVGGEVVSPNHARRVLEAYPAVRLINGYGPTENTTFTLCHDIALSDTDSSGGIPIGRPIRGTEVRIGLDEIEADHGELLAGGLGVALGYLGDSTLTADKFIEWSGRRWYRTGDLVRRRVDGALEYVGRVDRQVKLQGHRVELDEIERAMARCPGVGEALVLVAGDTVETRHLLGCFTAHDTSLATPAAVGAFLAESLPSYAVPRILRRVARFPRGNNGKVDRAELAVLLVELPGMGEMVGTPLRSETERHLAAIWKECVPGAEVRGDTVFTAIGGTSLAALRVSALVRRRLGRALLPVDVLRVPVLAEQAECVDNAPRVTLHTPTSSAMVRTMPLTRLQRSMLQGTQLDASGCAYLVHVALCVEGEIDRAAVRAAFTTLAARHPMLRVRVRIESGADEAPVHPTLADGWWHEHGDSIEIPSNGAWPADLLEDINHPLDLLRDGVMRVHVWAGHDGSSLVVWTVHHLAVDEASIDVSLDELDALLSERPLELVHGTAASFAELERTWADHSAARTTSSTIISVLGDSPAAVPPAPGAGGELPLVVPRHVGRALLDTSSAAGMTPFAPLLTSYGLALQDVFGGENRFVNTPFSRRADFGLFEPLGCLLDMRVLEAGARPRESLGDALARIHAETLALQKASFLPMQDVIAAVSHASPDLARRLNAFGFTWRMAPARSIKLGTQPARLLRVPQMGARFGMALHGWIEAGQLRCSIEATTSTIDGGFAARVGEAFVRRLAAMTNELQRMAALRLPPANATLADVTVDQRLAGVLRDAFSDSIHCSAADIDDSSDYFRLGGNSLSAMRMIAHIESATQLRIGVAAFMQLPTFGGLCGLARRPIARAAGDCAFLGAPDAARLLVIIPGDSLSPISSYALARECHDRLGDDYCVVIVDLEQMMLGMPEDRMLEGFVERLERLIADLGWHRVAALAGHSNGGLLALSVAQRSTAMTAPPVWLLDSYAPFGKAEAKVHRVVRPIARKLLEFAPVAAALRTHVREPVSPLMSTTMRLRELAREQIARDWTETPGGEVHLVQATQTVREVGLVRRRGTNGFHPAMHALWEVHHVEGTHFEIVDQLAPVVSSLIVASLSTPSVVD